MNAYLEPSCERIVDSAATLPRFPVNKVGASLLSIIQSAMDGVIVIDATRQIVLINHKAERMFGYPAWQLLDQPVEVLLPPRICPEQCRRIERLAATRMSGKSARVGLRGMHANGQEFPISACVSRITLRGEMYLAVILRETARQHLYGRKPRIPKPSDYRKLAVSSQQSSEMEKRRFSKELYDDIGQRLSVLKLDLDWLEHSLPERDECLPERIAQMQGMLDKVITLTKSMASAMRPPLLDDFGLMPAVQWMSDNFQKRTAIACSVEGIDVTSRLGEPVKSAVFRVIQEALLNIERHACASNVRIVLANKNRCLEILIEDDGIGMNEESINKPGCHGLATMQERIFILGGTIAIQNSEPQGVAIRASIPIDPLPAQ
jgi:PAS domain S-box-containing protein